MTEKQIEIADTLLKFLAEHDNHADKTVLSKYLKDKFGVRAGIDIAFVIQTLTQDYNLISWLSETMVMLTHEGCEMAQKGMKKFRKKLSLKEQFKVAKELIAIICTIFSIIIALLQLLIK